MPHEDFAPGTVWLIGAGPGDPDLLTRKALRLLLEADIVFHDALIGPAILALIPDETPRVDVGKRSGRHSKDQAAINDLLVAAAQAGRRVVRLKGGDPSIFGRSAEEVACLAAHGIQARICPGITAASAAAANASVSLTLRGQARKLTFLTARTQADDPADPDWRAVAKADATLAIYMGRAAAGDLARGLIAAGRSPDTPVLIAVNASLPNERLIRGRLCALAFLVRTISEDDPTLLLVGEAVGYAATPEPRRSAPPAAARPQPWRASPNARYRRPI